ncbi:MAG: hypothetical protein U1E05_07475, partial [Patescibacteria group bacterium]|nr:hypothetical protein [Patescibacteria group bacterium]
MKRRFPTWRGVWMAGLVGLLAMAAAFSWWALGMDVGASTWWRELAKAALTPSLLTLAVLAMVPIGVELLAHRARLADAAPRWMRHLEPALIGVAGLLLTLLAAWTAAKPEPHAREETFTLLAPGRTAAVAEQTRLLQDTELAGPASFILTGSLLTVALAVVFGMVFRRRDELERLI